MFLSDDDMVECPYNKTHRMLRKRLQSHLLKCRVHYPDVELRKCPFNITHLIPEPEYAHHATNCPDRKLITQYKYNAPEPQEDEVPRHAPVECEENWDDIDVNDYNPRLYMEKAKVIRKPDGLNKSERKLFIKKERKRLGDGSDSSDDDRRSELSSAASSRHQRADSYDSAKYYSSSTYSDGTREKNYRFKRYTSPSTSACSKERSRSPTNFYKRERSRSPTISDKRERSRSPVGSKSRRYGHTSDYYPSDQNTYYSASSRKSNNQFNNGSASYYSRGSNSCTYDRNINTDNDYIMPEAPPPPMISYPLRRSNFSTKYQPPASGR